MRKILLIGTTFQRSDIKAFIKEAPPIGLLAIAGALLKAGFEVELIDPQIQKDCLSAIDAALDDDPIFAGMTTFMGTNILNARDIAMRIKKYSPNTPIVFGGPLATSSPAMCFERTPVDYIVMGMGETTSCRIASALLNNSAVEEIPHVTTRQTVKDVYNFTENLDDFAYPQLDLWQEGIRILDTIPIISSRGCPRNCAFCYNNNFTGKKKWYPRSAKNVLDEMEHWGEVFNLKKFYFVDDNFLVNTERAVEILSVCRQRGYEIDQVIGHLYDFKPQVLNEISNYIEKVCFSTESASPRIQKLLNKVLDTRLTLKLVEDLSRLGIHQISTNFMFGLPGEADEDIAANIDLALRIRAINPMARMVPFVYTPQPKDDIIPHFDFYSQVNFSFEAMSSIDLAPNRTLYLSSEIRPWMTKEDISFYLNLVLVWFHHFDHVVRASRGN